MLYKQHFGRTRSHLITMSFNIPLLSAPLKRITTNILRAAMSTSIMKTKLDYFDERMRDGWDPNGNFKNLHLLKPYRQNFIMNELGRKGVVKQGNRPLEGLKVLDVGCGVGLTTEMMAALGADVIGIDPTETAIQKAKQHAHTHSPSLLPRLQYHASTAEAHVVNNTEQYDVIMAFYVLEHINHRKQFLNNCINMLKKDGSLFIQHTNQTWRNGLWFLIWQMRVTKLYPTGLVSYSQMPVFDDVIDILTSSGCKLVKTQGINSNFRGDGFHWTNSSTYNNMIHVLKTGH